MILRSDKIDRFRLERIAHDHGLTIEGTGKLLRTGQFRTDFRLMLTELSPKDKNKTAKFQRRGREDRRIHAVCWHGHRDVMKAIFFTDPEARLTSMLADYKGKEDFEDKFEATGYTNIGSMVSPLYANEACDCQWD